MLDWHHNAIQKVAILHYPIGRQIRYNLILSKKCNSNDKVDASTFKLRIEAHRKVNSTYG